MVEFNLDTCQVIVYGYRVDGSYHSHSHIHEGFYRALKFLGRDVFWIDQKNRNPLESYDNVLVITNHDVAKNLPLNKSWFYVIHGFNDYEPLRERFQDMNVLSWNVYHDCSHSHAPGGAGPIPGACNREDGYLLARDAPFYPKEKRVDFRWATDLLPHEIMSLKSNEMLGFGSNVINHVGTVWWVNEKELSAFRKACEEDGKEFRHLGAGQNGIVSVDDNIKLVRESFMAPAIVGSHHITEGYAPCRIFKNISYGHMGITNSARVNNLFDNRLIYDPDPYNLYWHAKEMLSGMEPDLVHALMDTVARDHTYLNRLDVVCKAIKLVLEMK
jgi:hypothetical protein